jgi:hypothetical protein
MWRYSSTLLNFDCRRRLSSHFHAPAALHPGKRTSGTHRLRKLIVSRTGLNAHDKGKICSRWWYLNWHSLDVQSLYQLKYCRSNTLSSGKNLWHMTQARVVQIPGASVDWVTIFVLWLLMFLGPQGTELASCDPPGIYKPEVVPRSLQNFVQP